MMTSIQAILSGCPNNSVLSSSKRTPRVVQILFCKQGLAHKTKLSRIGVVKSLSFPTEMSSVSLPWWYPEGGSSAQRRCLPHHQQGSSWELQALSSPPTPPVPPLAPHPFQLADSRAERTSAVRITDASSPRLSSYRLPNDCSRRRHVRFPGPGMAERVHGHSVTSNRLAPINAHVRDVT